jgi:hypothetical protein
MAGVPSAAILIVYPASPLSLWERVRVRAD